MRKLGRGELVPRVDRVGKRVFDSSKLTDHHAIIPLDRPPENLPATHRKVYDLVYRKFVGAFMDDYVYELQRVFIRLDGELFLVEGKRNLQLGWMELYPMRITPENSERGGEEGVGEGRGEADQTTCTVHRGLPSEGNGKVRAGDTGDQGRDNRDPPREGLRGEEREIPLLHG